MNQRCLKEELNTKFNLNFNVINKRCSTRNKWPHKQGKQMKTVFKSKNRCAEIHFNMNFNLKLRWSNKESQKKQELKNSQILKIKPL